MAPQKGLVSFKNLKKKVSGRKTCYIFPSFFLVQTFLDELSSGVKVPCCISGGSKGGARTPPGPKFVHFYAVFRNNWSNNRLAPSPSGKSWIRHCLSIQPETEAWALHNDNSFSHSQNGAFVAWK